MTVSEQLRAAKARLVTTPEQRIAKYEEAFFAANGRKSRGVIEYHRGWYVGLSWRGIRAINVDDRTSRLFDRAIADAEGRGE